MYDFGACPGTGVDDIERNVHRIAFGNFRSRDQQSRIFKSRIRQSVSEWICHGLFRRIVIAVSHEDAFTIFGYFPFVKFAHRVVRYIRRESFGKFPGRVIIAEHQIVNGFSAGFAGQIDVQDCSDFVGIGSVRRRSARQYHGDIRVDPL